MKFSKSILIFLFVSSTTCVFYYSLKRTNGNIGQSIMFTLYFLGIKIGLIGPNIVMGLDQHQRNHLTKTSVLGLYRGYISASYDHYYRPSRLYMSETEKLSLVPQHSDYHGSICKLRGGNQVTDAALFLLILWMLQQESVGFQPVKPVRKPPHIEGRDNSLFRKPKVDCQNRGPTLLESQKGPQPDKKFYNSEVNCYFSKRQLQRKFKHAVDFGIDGNYNPENVKKFETALVDHMKLVVEPIDGSYHGIPVYHYFNEKTGLNVMIKKDNRTFMSGWKLTEGKIDYMKNGGNL